ncbi:2-oxoglutarate and Fe(II)-dependent oxygenase superfamily protein, partial [Prunus dulcis]
WAQIGVVTKKLWSKESQWHNRKYFEVESIKPASPFSSRPKTGRHLPELAGAASGHHRPRERWRSNAIESSSFADRSHARRRPVLAGNCERTTGTHRNFKAADLPPPATISDDPGIRDQADLQKRPTGGLASSDQEL